MFKWLNFDPPQKFFPTASIQKLLAVMYVKIQCAAKIYQIKNSTTMTRSICCKTLPSAENRMFLLNEPEPLSMDVFIRFGSAAEGTGSSCSRSDWGMARLRTRHPVGLLITLIVWNK